MDTNKTMKSASVEHAILIYSDRYSAFPVALVHWDGSCLRLASSTDPIRSVPREVVTRVLQHMWNSLCRRVQLGDELGDAVEEAVKDCVAGVDMNDSQIHVGCTVKTSLHAGWPSSAAHFEMLYEGLGFPYLLSKYSPPVPTVPVAGGHGPDASKEIFLSYRGRGVAHFHWTKKSGRSDESRSGLLVTVGLHQMSSPTEKQECWRRLGPLVEKMRSVILASFDPLAALDPVGKQKDFGAQICPALDDNEDASAHGEKIKADLGADSPSVFFPSGPSDAHQTVLEMRRLFNPCVHFGLPEVSDQARMKWPMPWEDGFDHFGVTLAAQDQRDDLLERAMGSGALYLRTCSILHCDELQESVRVGLEAAGATITSPTKFTRGSVSGKGIRVGRLPLRSFSEVLLPEGTVMLPLGESIAFVLPGGLMLRATTWVDDKNDARLTLAPWIGHYLQAIVLRAPDFWNTEVHADEVMEAWVCFGLICAGFDIDSDDCKHVRQYVRDSWVEDKKAMRLMQLSEEP